MDILSELGELALGSRLKRLSDSIMREGSIIYQQNSLDFEPKYFTIYYLLLHDGSQSIMDLAEKLGYAHPSIIQLVKEMEVKGWILSSRDKSDKRKRVLSLSNKAKQMAPQMTRVWDDIAKALYDLLAAYDTNFLTKIEQIENALHDEPLAQRVAAVTSKRKMDNIEVVEFDPAYATYFRDINYAWINKYFQIEKQDRKVLENPKPYIIDNGGYILFAKINGEIAGTCALINLGNNHYELSKMGVFEKYQGMQIGKKLGLAIINKAKSIGAEKISLDSNKKLKPALTLYKKLGFTNVNRRSEKSLYERSNVYMEMVLTANSVNGDPVKSL